MPRPVSANPYAVRRRELYRLKAEQRRAAGELRSERTLRRQAARTSPNAERARAATLARERENARKRQARAAVKAERAWVPLLDRYLLVATSMERESRGMGWLRSQSYPDALALVEGMEHGHAMRHDAERFGHRRIRGPNGERIPYVDAAWLRIYRALSPADQQLLWYG